VLPALSVTITTELELDDGAVNTAPANEPRPELTVKVLPPEPPDVVNVREEL
jgi:hypothetical protein